MSAYTVIKTERERQERSRNGRDEQLKGGENYGQRRVGEVWSRGWTGTSDVNPTVQGIPTGIPMCLLIF